jgi:hypothetical protein
MQKTWARSTHEKLDAMSGMRDCRRDQIIALLRDHPDGIVTLLLFERLGASTDAERQSVTHILGRMVAGGQVCRSLGTGLRAVWTLGANPAAPSRRASGFRGAAELALARARSAAAMRTRAKH